MLLFYLSWFVLFINAWYFFVTFGSKMAAVCRNYAVLFFLLGPFSLVSSDDGNAGLLLQTQER